VQASVAVMRFNFHVLALAALASACSSKSGDQGGHGACDSYVPLAVSRLQTNPKLPDPFLSPDGTRIASQQQWPCRRAEIRNQALTYELGPEPPAPAAVLGVMNGNKLTVTASNADGSNSISFDATIALPPTGTAPYPAIIGVGGVSIGATQLAAMGVATVLFPNDALAQQQDGSSRGKGLFYDFNPTFKTTGAMVGWAWGVGRLIDAIEQTPASQIDPTRLGVTGCSRNGKGALVVGALEERIVLTIPQESGAGGAASWRVSDYMVANGTQVQTLSEITGENVWFASGFSQFGNSASKLPFDHHMIEGLVAPRALLVIENSSMAWLGNLSTYTSSMAGHMIWEALGIPDRMGFSQVGHPDHCGWSGAQQPEVTAYVQRFLLGSSDTVDSGALDGGSVDTNVLKSDAGFTLDTDRWIDWSVPSLP
jgi:hypothetical protein